MNFKTIFLFFSLIIKIDCFIKVPFTYFPDKSYEKIGLKNKILSILDLKMYGLLEIGTPKQLCDQNKIGTYFGRKGLKFDPLKRTFIIN